MKLFRCACGSRIFFDNTVCGSCGSSLGFDPDRLELLSLTPASGESFSVRNGAQFRYCKNVDFDGACNWLVPVEQNTSYCLGCERTELIPSLDVPGNLRLWTRLEAAKRRLLYTLLLMRLPLETADGERQLRFRFLEDRRRNPAVEESFVSTGHYAGTITINLAEADDVARHAIREEMQERYRTLLGHFRHESAHFYFESLILEQNNIEEFRELFGNELSGYEEALQSYYRKGAPEDWPSRFVSAYASAHAHEDWAETFAHYLHIADTLETAKTSQLVVPKEAGASSWILEWMELSVTLNELNRSLGLDDPYPFVLTDTVVRKLTFIDRLVRPRDGRRSTASR